MPKTISLFFHHLFISISVIIITDSKKILHFDHSDSHEEILCWTVKLRDIYDFASRLHVGNGLKRNPISIGSTSHFAIEEFPGHYLICHSGEEETLPGTNLQGLHGQHRLLKQRKFDKFLQVKDKIERDLYDLDNVEWFSQEVVRRRQKRSIHFNDPEYVNQWHLKNSHVEKMDINVTGVWEQNITGQGVTVAVVDDGMEWKNPDLHANYNLRGSWDLNDDDPDPSPSSSKATNHHGTRCAGEIAAVANNNICGVGVAYGAMVSGIRVLDGPMTDSLEAAAFNKKLQVNDVYSCSWGPDDDGMTVDGPHIMAAKAMKYGVDFGRRGYGSIFVVASGNGGRHHDNCNYDGYANSIYTLTIGAVDEMGQMPYYAEECASMLGVTFSSGQRGDRDIVTTDWTARGGEGCTHKHTGTSAAAPLAAAMIALMLQARSCLTWRDVQYLTILTAVKVDVDIAHWQKNGAGLFHSHKHGFGLLKAWRMVNAAKIWETVPWLTSFSFGESSVNLRIPKKADGPLKVTRTVTQKDIEGFGLYILENVEVTVTITHPRRGKVGVKLISPSGTVSVIGAPRPLDNSTNGFQDWTFSTVRCWGEVPTGNWTLVVMDTDKSKYGPGFVKKWQIILFGTPLEPEEFQNRRRKIEAAMSGEFLNSNFSLPCSSPPVVAHPDIPMSHKTLKILVLACAFCAVMAVYESLEYALCYNEEKKEHAAKMKLQERARRLARQNLGSDYINPEDASEFTGLLQSEEIPMETFSVNENGNGVSGGSEIFTGNHEFHDIPIENEEEHETQNHLDNPSSLFFPLANQLLDNQSALKLSKTRASVHDNDTNGDSVFGNGNLSDDMHEDGCHGNDVFNQGSHGNSGFNHDRHGILGNSVFREGSHCNSGLELGNHALSHGTHGNNIHGGSHFESYPNDNQSLSTSTPSLSHIGAPGNQPGQNDVFPFDNFMKDSIVMNNSELCDILIDTNEEESRSQPKNSSDLSNGKICF